MHVQGIATYLQDNGHEVMVFCRYGDTDDAEGTLRNETVGGIRVVRFNNAFCGPNKFESTYINSSAHLAFEGVLDGFEPDVVHVHHLIGLSTTILAACKKRHCPLVYSLHDFWVVCPRGQRLTPDLHLCETIDRNKCYTCLRGLWPEWFGDRMAAKNVEVQPGRLSPEILVNWDAHMVSALEMPDILLTPSKFHRHKMIELGIDGDRIIALAHGLDHKRIQPAEQNKTVNVIGYIGSVIPIKGVHVLLEAFAILDRDDVELHIWGEAPDYHERAKYTDDLKALALGARGNVRIYNGYKHDEVGRILNSMDILVVPSIWWETFSLTIREGMLAQLPIVASDIGAMREALDTHNAGFLFEAGNAVDLADSLASLIDSPALRDEFSQARDTVKTVEQNAEEYVGIYDKARELAKQREAALVVPETDFAEEESPPPPATIDQAGPPAVSSSSMDLGDVYFELQQTGGGPVSLSSAVDRNDGTSVCFRISQGDSELQLTVRIPQGNEATGVPTTDTAKVPDEEAPTPSIDPATVSRSASGMLLGQSAAHDEAEQAKAMFSLNPQIISQHVSALDDMIEVTHLDEEGNDDASNFSPARPEPPATPDDSEMTIADAEVIDVEATPEPEGGIVFGKTNWSIPEATGDAPKTKATRHGKQQGNSRPDAGSFGDGIE